jgi:hypothetical protein
MKILFHVEIMWKKKGLNATFYAYPLCVSLCRFVLIELRKAPSILNSNNTGIFKFAT